MQARRWKGIAALVAVTALLAGFASGAQARTAAGTSTDSAAADPIKVGIVYTRTGLLATYGAQYIQGLRYGLAYATKGTNSVNGRKIELTIVDDGFDATKAVAAGKDLIGKGYKILAGSVGSGIAAQMAPLAAQNKVLFISGPAAADAITGI
jgi:branched-chain amino acid transport system substrate-binding protein